jgi:hypothetical protein
VAIGIGRTPGARLLHIAAMSRVSDPDRTGALRAAGYYAGSTWRFS